MQVFFYLLIVVIATVLSFGPTSANESAIFDFHDVRGREAKEFNLTLDQVVVKGSTIEHLGTEHDGFYSITFDPVPDATGIELEWANEGSFKHWTVREIEAYANFETKIDIVAGKVVPGPARTADNVFSNAFDGDVGTFTYTTQSGTTVAPQRTLLDLGPGSHTLDRIRINDVADNGANGRMQQITVRITTDTNTDLAARKYIDVANLSVPIFGVGLMEGELLPMKGSSRPQGMNAFGNHWSGDAHLLWDGEIGQIMETEFVVESDGKYKLQIQLTLAPDYGKFTLHIDGREMRKEIDLYSPKVELAPVIDLGELELKGGPHKVQFTLSGANKKALPFRKKGYLLGIDYFRLIEQGPAKTELNEALALKKPDKPKKVVVSLDEMIPVMSTYCFDCHGNKPKVKGKVNLRKIVTKKDFLNDIELTRKIAEVLAYKEMPPEEEKQPTENQRIKMSALFNGYLEQFVKESGSLKPIVMRRLNRYEYNNAVRDLLKLRGDVYPLPEKVIRGRGYFNPSSGHFPSTVNVSNRALGKNQIERHILTGVSPFAIDLQSEHGFNNRGDELGMSPIMLESFLKLGRSIVNAPEFDGYCDLTNSFFSNPNETDKNVLAGTAGQRLRPFLGRAFRTKVSDQVLSRYVNFVAGELNRGQSFSQSMKNATAAVLSSPRFLYLTERKRDADKEEPLNSYELASRLSFFFWSSIPDEELLDKARTGDLLNPDIYSDQVKRLLESPKSKALAENFARQWLRLDQLITAVPDFDRFQIYYSRIGCEQWKFGLQTMIEPLLLFESIMVEDRSIMLLIDSNYSFRSDEMQSWYKDKTPFGNRANRNRFSTNSQIFTRRSLESRREGGVITSAATLTMTSEPLRTSPIRRGAWVATVIFNRPPPPPPDVVPEIEKDDAEIEAKGLTLRQRLVAHQENQSCVSCHQKIDPLGFALENYDAIGRWRDEYRSGLQIDASGELFGKTNFNNVVELKDVLLENPQWFLRAFCEHMLSYALGRELDLSDKPAVDKMVINVMAERGKFSTVVYEIVSSYPFLHKTNQINPPKP